MTKHSALNKSVSIPLLILLVSTFLFTQHFISIRDAKAEPGSAVLKVIPSNVTTGTGSTFTITVKVYNVTNLYGWQVRLRFDDRIVNTTASEISFPSDNIFNYTTNVLPLGPYVEYLGSPSNYYPYTYLQVGQTLYGATAFNGTGTLFIARFTGQSGGTTTLEFVLTETKLKDNQALSILYTAENGQATVTGGPTPGKAGSFISIIVNPATVTVGSNVTISGAINVTRPNVDVTIKYRPTSGTFSPLAVIKTNSTSGYTYTWNTTGKTPGNYEIQASWGGDDQTNSAVSEIKTVTIQGLTPPSPPDYTLYIAGAVIVVVIIAALALYLFRFRKP